MIDAQYPFAAGMEARHPQFTYPLNWKSELRDLHSDTPVYCRYSEPSQSIHWSANTQHHTCTHHSASCREENMPSVIIIFLKEEAAQLEIS